MKRMKSKIRPLLTFLIGWPLSLLALFFIIKTFLPRLQSISHNLTQVNGWLFGIGIICFLGYYFLRSVVWNQLVQTMGFAFPLHETMYYWASSEFKRYIPGNIWSFVGRSVLFTNKGMSKKEIGRALVIEQELVLLGCLFASLLSIPFLAKHLFPQLQTLPFLYQIVFIFIILVLSCYVLLPRYLGTLPIPLLKREGKLSLVQLLPDFSTEKTLAMICISTLAFLFWGLGYYFTVSSFVFLHPQDVWSLSGFFVFSMLVGLLSFLTPTGLGVREGMITYGLGKIIPLDIAGFVSIAGRIVLVLSEGLFLLIAYIFHRFSEPLHGICVFGKKYTYEIVLAMMIALFCAYFIPVSMLRHTNFYTGRFDLGNMDQTVWNTMHGRIFQFTNPDSTETVSRLAFHADFFLILLAPFYLIWNDPRMLLVIQSIIVALGAIFVYLLTINVFNSRTPHPTLLPQGRGQGEGNAIKLLALALSLSYLLNPSLQRSVIYDFHALTVATTFLLGAFYFIYKKKYGWFIIFSLLAGITKEEIWVTIAFLGGCIVFTSIAFANKGKLLKEKLLSKHVIFGGMVMVVSFAIFFLLFWKIIPNAAKGEHFALSYFSEDNESPSQLIKGTLFSPQKTFSKLMQRNRIDYMKKLLLPVGYIPVAAPYMLIFPSADLVLNLLSDKSELQQIYYQYTAPITPFLFIGMIFGIKNILRFSHIFSERRRWVFNFGFRISDLLIVFVLLMSVYGSYMYGPLPGSREPNLDMMTKPPANKAYITQALASIDSSLSVSASNSLGAHLTHREHIYTIPQGVDLADVVIFDLHDPYAQPSQIWHKEKAASLRTNLKYQILFENRDFIAFRKK
jgi:uncharacterized membrane protein/uncharacterized membrane protein YbhN (UPF0104 family)